MAPDGPAATDAALHDALARGALGHYGHAEAHLKLLRRGDNAVYRVTGDRGRFVLRLHTSGRHGGRALTSELAWLDHLSRAADLPVPHPVRATSGAWAVQTGGAETPPVWCSLLSWVEGESLAEDGGLTAPQAFQAGELLARLHLEAGRFVVPQDFERPRYSLEHFRTCWHGLTQSLTGQVPGGRLAGLRSRLERVSAPLREMEDLPGGYGLIHADPHPGNFLQREAGLGLLDFDRCGWGPFLLDIAHTSLDLEESVREALFSGYRGVRALPAGAEAPLRALRILAAVENLAFLARRPHERPFVLEALPFIERAASKLDA